MINYFVNYIVLPFQVFLGLNLHLNYVETIKYRYKPVNHAWIPPGGIRAVLSLLNGIVNSKAN